MGRPLYSRTFITTPAVWEPEQPIYEKWSYLNAFDPDSDEFFDSENAVYEDFVDPVTLANPEGEEAEEEEERDMLVVRMGNASPVISDSSLSDTESLLASGTEDPVDRSVDAFHGIQVGDTESEPAIRVRLATRVPMRRQLATRTAFRGGPYRSYSHHDILLPVPTPSAPIPVPAVSRRSDERAFPSPSTPPHQTPVTHISMSPPPASTPRLYTWASNPAHSPSPSSGSPFTNPRARTSYTHLSPAVIRIRDLAV